MYLLPSPSQHSIVCTYLHVGAWHQSQRAHYKSFYTTQGASLSVCHKQCPRGGKRALGTWSHLLGLFWAHTLKQLS